MGKEVIQIAKTDAPRFTRFDKVTAESRRMTRRAGTIVYAAANKAADLGCRHIPTPSRPFPSPR